MQMAANLILRVQFAIRTTIRNHAVLTRDVVIKHVANAVGSPHTVDLTKYQLLILVEIYKVRNLAIPVALTPHSSLATHRSLGGRSPAVSFRLTRFYCVTF